jgi:hypothetical protein
MVIPVAVEITFSVDARVAGDPASARNAAQFPMTTSGVFGATVMTVDAESRCPVIAFPQ